MPDSDRLKSRLANDNRRLPKEAVDDDRGAQRRWGSRIRRVLGWGLTRVLPVLILIWIAGDLIYSRVVLSHLDQWEQTIPRDADGVQQGHREYTLGDGSTALLLVHGINFSPYVYKNLAPPLAERGYTCRVMRLPGFAMPVRQYSQHRYPEWVEAVAVEVAALKAKHPHVIIVAHSLGGAVTIRALLERHLDVDGVVLMAPAIEVSNARSPLGLSTRFWHEFARRTLFFTQIVQSPFTYDINDPQARQEIPQQPFMPRSIADETFKLIDANRGRASELDYPLLMILARHDKIIDTAAAQSFFDAWGCSDKQLVFQAKSAHMIPLDFGWQELPGRIADFVERQAKNSKLQGPGDERSEQ